jgi:hypothetical protein
LQRNFLDATAQEHLVEPGGCAGFSELVARAVLSLILAFRLTAILEIGFPQFLAAGGDATELFSDTELLRDFKSIQRSR